jgi:hypothetical protein
LQSPRYGYEKQNNVSRALFLQSFLEYSGSKKLAILTQASLCFHGLKIPPKALFIVWFYCQLNF